MCVQDNYGIKAKQTTSHKILIFHKQMKSLRKYTKLYAIVDMIRSFDSENNHENLEKEDNDHLIQSTALATRSTYHTIL
jgi:hypothetical protein